MLGSAYVGSTCGGKQHTRGPNAKKHQQQMTSKRDAAGRSIDGEVALVAQWKIKKDKISQRMLTGDVARREDV